MDFEGLKEICSLYGFRIEHKSDGIYAYNVDSDNLFDISIIAKAGCDMQIVFNSQVTSLKFSDFVLLNNCMDNTERAARTIMNSGVCKNDYN